MFSLTYHPQDAANAEHLRSQLLAEGLSEHGSTAGSAAVDIILLTPASLQDKSFLNDIYALLDRGGQMIIVKSQNAVMPKLLAHLPLVSLEDPSTPAALHTMIDAALAPGARLPMKVLTPATRRSNARFGLLVLAFVLGMFAVGIYSVAVLNIEVPIEEYNEIDTQVAATRDSLLAPTLESFLPYLPGDAAQALEYPATLEAVPTRIRPFVAATATAVAIEQQD
jgi:hypothetical protein